MPILSIDPGRNGGIVILDDRQQVVRAWRMPTKGKDIQWDALLEKFGKVAHWNPATVVVMEQVQVFTSIEYERRRDGSTKPVAKAMFGTQQLLETSGGIKACLAMAGFAPVCYFSTQWKAAYRQRGGKSAKVPGETQANATIAKNKANKLQSMAIANSIWPYAAEKFGKDWTDGTAEAALLGAFHARRVSIEPTQVR